MTTSQKIKCANTALSKVLGASYRVVGESIDLKKTAMQKYNIVANVADAVGDLESEQNHVIFLAQDKDERVFEGSIIMQTEKDDSILIRQNNTTTKMQELTSSQVFRCTLTVTQFSGTDDTTRDVSLRDLKLQLLGE